MRYCSFALIITLFGGISGGCAMNGDTEDSQTAEVAVPALSAFVLTVTTEEQPITVTTSTGTNTCPDSCSFAYIAGTSLSIHAGARNFADCLQFNSWIGACAGQGNPCTLVINSDLSTTAHYTSIPGCVPQ